MRIGKSIEEYLEWYRFYFTVMGENRSHRRKYGHLVTDRKNIPILIDESGADKGKQT